MSTTRPLPKLVELHHDPEVAFKNDELKLLLSQPPHVDWLKTNTYAQGAKYLPIDKVEFLLDRLFQEWKVEVLETGQLLNAIKVVVRLHYRDPTSGEWKFHDGVAAKTLQVVKATGILQSDLSNLSPAAVDMALPIAKSIAIRDAADHLGRLFGRDLNRKDTIADFTGSYSQVQERAKEPEPQPVAKPTPAAIVVEAPPDGYDMPESVSMAGDYDL